MSFGTLWNEFAGCSVEILAGTAIVLREVFVVFFSFSNKC
jgi:hypothetical protein